VDCDLSHPPETLVEMRPARLALRGRRRHRRLEPDSPGNQPPRRLARVLAGAGRPFSDLSGDFKLWRVDCLAAIA
jgi:hypothetical protein